jgi:predicted nucleotidyltransferase
MKKRLLDLSGKIDRLLVDLFENIAKAAENISAPFFVVGATARDIILKYGYGIETIRATNDIDIGVEVSDWDQYNNLRKGLVATGKFETSNEPQRLKYQESLIIDIIPFGAIADSDGSFLWPPNDEVEMNTLGFGESYQDALAVRLKRKPDLDIKFASPAGLALLKLVSWNDRRSETSKDAKDLALLMRTHIEAGNEERLFAQESDLIEILKETGGFDYQRASARLLGRDISAITSSETREKLLRILEEETDEQGHYTLVRHMTDIHGGSNSDYEENLAFVGELKAGLMEGPSKSKRQV